MLRGRFRCCVCRAARGGSRFTRGGSFRRLPHRCGVQQLEEMRLVHRLDEVMIEARLEGLHSVLPGRSGIGRSIGVGGERGEIPRGTRTGGVGGGRNIRAKTGRPPAGGPRSARGDDPERRLERLADPEVRDDRVAFVERDVLRFDIAVHHIVPVRVVGCGAKRARLARDPSVGNGAVDRRGAPIDQGPARARNGGLGRGERRPRIPLRLYCPTAPGLSILSVLVRTINHHALRAGPEYEPLSNWRLDRCGSTGGKRCSPELSARWS